MTQNKSSQDPIVTRLNSFKDILNRDQQEAEKTKYVAVARAVGELNPEDYNFSREYVITRNAKKAATEGLILFQKGEKVIKTVYYNSAQKYMEACASKK